MAGCLLFRISDVGVYSKGYKKGLLKHSCSKLFWLNYNSSKVGLYYNGNRLRINSSKVCRQHCNEGWVPCYIMIGSVSFHYLSKALLAFIHCVIGQVLCELPCFLSSDCLIHLCIWSTTISDDPVRFQLLALDHSPFRNVPHIYL